MIDIHTHVLPGIDDGASSVNEALQMLQSLHMQGITKVVCTPHFDPSRISFEAFIDNRNTAIHRLNGVNVELLSASETVLHDYLFHYPELKGLCIENTRYLLIELPHGEGWSKRALERLEKLMSYYDVIPIIAHIERYHKRFRRDSYIKKLIGMGCLIQVNTSSIIDRKVRNRLLGFVKKGFVDVLGSDCHNLRNRPPIFKEALEIISKQCGEQYCSGLLERSMNIVMDKEIMKTKSFII